ncbi:MAG: FAD-binding protein, partial [Paraprevotella sp.]|nr:FAD-binding protein [Paraprevotella sp.]
MKFDNIIIGGGLSGLLCGIALAREGRHVAVIAAGQSTLHFSSGSFDILGYEPEGKVVTNPFDALHTLPAEHPYHLVGLENVPLLASQALRIFTECGLKGQGG